MAEKMAQKLATGKKVRGWSEADRGGVPGSVLSEHGQSKRQIDGTSGCVTATNAFNPTATPAIGALFVPICRWENRGSEPATRGS